MRRYLVKKFIKPTLILASQLAIGCPLVAYAQDQPVQAGDYVTANAHVTEVISGLEHPWALAPLPDGQMLITERPGRLRLLDVAGKLSQPLTGTPKVFAQGQGGLMDVVPSPASRQTA